MRALIFDGQNVRLDANHPAPSARPDEAVVALSKAIVSRVDLELTRGLLDYRGVLGHQFVGVVESANGSSSSLIGKRVVASISSACGKCDMCLTGLGPHCRNRSMLGMNGTGGCLAERFSLPARSLMVVPANVPDEHAVFAVDVAAALQTISQLTIVGKPYISVIGDTPLGLLTAQLMAKLNASVRWMGWQSESVAVCEKWGLKHRLADEAGRRADQDIVVDCSNNPAGIDLAMKLVRPRGKIVLKSLYAHPNRVRQPLVDLTPIVLNEIEVIGSHGGSVAEAIARIGQCEVDFNGLVSKQMGLSSGQALLKTAAQPGVIAVLVEP